MTIQKTSVKTYAEFPYLAFLHSNKGKMEERYKRVFQNINQAIDSFCQQYPEVVEQMSCLFWGDNRSNLFRLPIAILKNRFFFIELSTLLQKERVTNVGQCVLSHETNIQNILGAYRTHFFALEKWESQKRDLFQEFEHHESIQNVSFIKQFIDDIQHLFGKGNLTYIIGDAESEKYLRLANDFSAAFTQKKIPPLDAPCSHQKIDIVTTTSSPTANCCNCLFQAIFHQRYSQWIVAPPSFFIDCIRRIKDFYKIIDNIELASIPLIQFVISLSDVLRKVPLAVYQHFQKTMPDVKGEPLLGDISIPQEPDTLYVYKRIQKSNLPHISQFSSVAEWVKHIDLSAFQDLYNKQNRYASVLQELCSTDAAILLDSWNQYRDEVKRIFEAAKQHIPSQLAIRPTFTLVKEEIISMFSLIQELDGAFGLTTIADMLRGAKTAKMRDYGLNKHEMYGSIPHRKSLELREALEFLLKKNFAVQVGSDYPKLKLTKKGVSYVNLVKHGISAAAQENKEKEQFLQNSFDVFLGHLQSSIISDEWKMEYIQRKMEENEVGTYRGLVLHAANHRDSIPFIEPILKSYFKEQYMPVFQMYTRTRKHSYFARMIESILIHRRAVSC